MGLLLLMWHCFSSALWPSIIRPSIFFFNLYYIFSNLDTVISSVIEKKKGTIKPLAENHICIITDTEGFCRYIHKKGKKWEVQLKEVLVYWEPKRADWHSALEKSLNKRGSMYAGLQGCVTLPLAEMCDTKIVPGRVYQPWCSSSSYRQLSPIITMIFGYLISVIPTQTTSRI